MSRDENLPLLCFIQTNPRVFIPRRRWPRPITNKGSNRNKQGQSEQKTECLRRENESTRRRNKENIRALSLTIIDLKPSFRMGGI